MANPLRELGRYGQSVWYDSLRRGILVSGELARTIEEDGLTGLTTNPPSTRRPSRAAATTTPSWRSSCGGATSTPRRSTRSSPSTTSRQRPTCCAPCYERTARRDGYVSLEVSPVVALDAGAQPWSRRVGCGARSAART